MKKMLSGTVMVILSVFCTCLTTAQSILIEPAEASFCSLGTQIFKIDLQIGATAYQWEQRVINGDNWEDIDGANGPIYQAQNVTPPGMEYRVKVLYNIGNPQYSEIAKLHVYPAPPAIVLNAAQYSICSGGNVLISILNADTFNVSWTGPSNFTNTSATIYADEVGEFTATVSGNLICPSTIAIANVTLAAFPTPNINASKNPVCANEPLILEENSNTGIQWKWIDPDSNLLSGNILNITLPKQGSYKVTVTNSSGCTASSSIVIDVKQPPLAQISPEDTIICLGNPVLLNANTLNIIDWKWTAPNGDTFNGASNYLINPIPGTYSVIVTGINQCIDSAFATIKYPDDLNNIWISTTKEALCSGQSALLAINGLTIGINYTFSWSDQTMGSSTLISAPGTYSLTVTNGIGCAAVFTKIIAEEKVEFDIIAPDKVCKGLPITLSTSNANMALPWSWKWSGTAVNVPTNVQTIFVTTPLPAGTYTYTVTVTNANMCSGIQSKTITVIAPPTPMIEGPAIICSKSVDQIFTTTEKYEKYEWTLAGSGLLRSDLTRPFARTDWPLSGIGSIQVKVIDGGCTGEASKSVNISIDESLPKGYIFLKPSKDILIFDNDTVNITNYSYQWGALRIIDSATYNFVEITLPSTIGTTTVYKDRQYYYIGVLDPNLVYFVKISETGNNNCKTVCYYPSNPYERSDGNGIIITPELEPSRLLKVYPNPAKNGQFSAILPNAFSGTSTVAYRLINAHGQLICQGNEAIESYRMTFDFSQQNLSQGLYFLEIYNPAYGLYLSTKVVFTP